MSRKNLRISSLDEDLGNRDAPPGSEPWVKYFVRQAQRAYKDLESDVQSVQDLLTKLDAHSAWKTRGYLSFQTFCNSELHIDPETLTAIVSAPKHAKLRDVIALGKHGGNRQKTNTQQDSNRSLIKGGTNLAYGLARLERDRPDLAVEVRRGKLSVNAAAIEAGFRVKTISIPLDVIRAASKIRKHFTQQEITELRKALR